jgi:hypothetical protein
MNSVIFGPFLFITSLFRPREYLIFLYNMSLFLYIRIKCFRMNYVRPQSLLNPQMSILKPLKNGLNINPTFHTSKRHVMLKKTLSDYSVWLTRLAAFIQLGFKSVVLIRNPDRFERSKRWNNAFFSAPSRKISMFIYIYRWTWYKPFPVKSWVLKMLAVVLPTLLEWLSHLEKQTTGLSQRHPFLDFHANHLKQWKQPQMTKA